jgi:hypothetical protein
MSLLPRSVVAPLFLGLLAASCGGGDGDQPKTDRKALLDSQSCQNCHPNHYQEWAASMHAYSSDDPVFMAMNKRGQRETGGKLGDFCVKCHAPVALREGQTSDGTNLEQVDRSYKGVTCYFCHSIESVSDAHDNPIKLATDGAMLGPITDPVSNPFHASRASKLLDSTYREATAACGSCHDIVNKLGTPIERTFAEWRGSLFAGTVGLGCGGCHLEGRDASAAATNVDKLRRVHDHRMVGVDVALTTWPGMDDQKALINKKLGDAAQGALCYDERNNQIRAILDNVGAGHAWPSGASSDRRVWVEVTAYAGGQMIYQTGAVPDGAPLASIDDPDLWLIRDCFFDEAGKDVHMFWQAAKFTSNIFPPSPLVGPGIKPMVIPHYRWDLPSAASKKPLTAVPDRITMKVHLRPMGDDVLQDLVASGDLDPAVPSKIPTFDVAGGTVEWTKEAVKVAPIIERGSVISCVATLPFNPTTQLIPSHAKCEPPVAP